MAKIKTIYLVTGLLTLIVLGFLVTIPQFIPSFELVEAICVLVVYVLIIAFAYALIIRMRNYFEGIYSTNQVLIFTKLFAALIIIGLFISFILTSSNLGQGLFKGYFVEELHYPNYKVKLYLYDDSYIESFTTVKIKNKRLPVMKNVAFIEGYRPTELKISKNKDTVFFTSKDIGLKFNLKSLKVIKVYRRKKIDFNM
jgi:hypothetical protein